MLEMNIFLYECTLNLLKNHYVMWLLSVKMEDKSFETQI